MFQVKYSSVSLFSYLQEIDELGLRSLCYKILDIFEESHKNERMITSMLAFLDRLLSSGCIQVVLDDSENGIAEQILILLKQEIKTTNNTKLLISSINVFCQLLQVYLLYSILLCIFIILYIIIFYLKNNKIISK